MNNRLFAAVAFAAAVATAAGAEPAVPVAGAQGGPAIAPKSHRALTGGVVMKPLPEGSRAIVFLDAREGVTNHAAVVQCARRVEAMTRLYVKDAVGPVPAIGETRDIVVALVDKGEFTIMPEAGRAIVPARGSDVESSKALWQAAIAIFSLSGQEVNDLHGSGIVVSAAESLGIPRVTRVFYAKALKEGWAPPPVDEYQRALWEAAQTNKVEAAKAE